MSLYISIRLSISSSRNQLCVRYSDNKWSTIEEKRKEKPVENKWNKYGNANIARENKITKIFEKKNF